MGWKERLTILSRNGAGEVRNLFETLEPIDYEEAFFISGPSKNHLWVIVRETSGKP